jgi:hypothetical protein
MFNALTIQNNFIDEVIESHFLDKVFGENSKKSREEWI